MISLVTIIFFAKKSNKIKEEDCVEAKRTMSNKVPTLAKKNKTLKKKEDVGKKKYIVSIKKSVVKKKPYSKRKTTSFIGNVVEDVENNQDDMMIRPIRKAIKF